MQSKQNASRRLRRDGTVCSSFVSKEPAELEKFRKAARLLRKERAAPRYKAPTGKRLRLAVVEKAVQLQGESADDAGAPTAATGAAEVAVAEKAMPGEAADAEGVLVPGTAAAVAAEGTLARVTVQDETEVAAAPSGAALVAAKVALVAAQEILGDADEEAKASGSTASGSGASGAAVATVFADEVCRFVMD